MHAHRGPSASGSAGDADALVAHSRVVGLSIRGEHVLRTYCPDRGSARRGEGHRGAGEGPGPGPPDGVLTRGTPFAAEVGLKLVYADGGRAAVTLPVRAEAPGEDST